MRRWISLIPAVILVLLLRPALAQAPGAQANLDFEQGKPGAAPAGWLVPTEGFTAKSSEDHPQQGSFRTKVPDPARPLTERDLANLTAFARLLGYVRHFHPSDQA